MIRELQSFEIGSIVEGGKAFARESNVPGGFKPDVFCAFWDTCIQNGDGVVFATFDESTVTGALGAVLCPDMFNGDLVAVEAFWYVIKKYRGHGMKLLFGFENWARDNGAKRVAMIHLQHLHPAELGRLYERLGYRLVETHYVKDL